MQIGFANLLLNNRASRRLVWPAISPKKNSKKEASIARQVFGTDLYILIVRLNNVALFVKFFVCGLDRNYMAVYSQGIEIPLMLRYET